MIGTQSLRIFITGGAGCLGSSLTERYLERGDEVLVLDNFATGHHGSLPEGHKNLTVVEGSVADATLMSKLVAAFKPSYIIHSAASYKDPENWIEDTNVNVEGTINAVRAAQTAGVRRFINFHTALGYGRPDVVPIPVTAPMKPFTSYAISKQAGENYLTLSGLPFVSLRLANVTGPRLAIGPIPTFYKRLKAGQRCFCSRTIRDFVDMEDFLVIVDMALEDAAPTGFFNVSTGEGHSVRDIFDIVVDHLGVTLNDPVDEVDPGANDVPAVVLDPAYTIKMFHWTPRYSFEETVRRTLKWYDRHGVAAIYSHLSATALGSEQGASDE
jgi:UDP-glucose 4-epimerase